MALLLVLAKIDYMKPIRLSRYLALCGIASRRAADQIITKGLVFVNEEPCSVLGTKVTDGQDIVSYKGKVLKLPTEYSYLILHKPKNYICTKKDPQNRKTIYSLVDKAHKSLCSVGRLDYDSEGLMLLTNDGELANRLLHPKYHVAKKYFVIVKGFISDEKIKRLMLGIKLDKTLAKPSSVEIVKQDYGKSYFYMTITQGIKRQIRRMCSSVGHDVVFLRRDTFGSINLGSLEKGVCRVLSSSEISSLRKEPSL